MNERMIGRSWAKTKRRRCSFAVVGHLLSVAACCWVGILIEGCATNYPANQFVTPGVTISQAQDDLVQGFRYVIVKSGHRNAQVRDVQFKSGGFFIAGYYATAFGKATADPFTVEVEYSACVDQPVSVTSTMGISTYETRWHTIDGLPLVVQWFEADKPTPSSQWGKRIVSAIHALREASQAGLLMKQSSLEEFYAKANAWRALPVKPPLLESTRRHLLLAEEYTKAKDFPNALKSYMLALNEEPCWPPTHYNLATFLGELAQYDQAIYHMRCYLALVPEASNAREAQDQIYIWEAKPRTQNKPDPS